MLLLSYIRQHLFFHMIVISIYGVMFFSLLLVISEVLSDRGFNDYSVEETTYAFQVFDFSDEKINQIPDKLSEAEDLGLEDISICVRYDEYAVIAFLTPLSERRDSSISQIILDTDEILSDSGISTGEYFSSGNDFEKMGFKYSGTLDITYYLDKLPDMRIYCSANDLGKFIDDDSEVYLCFLFNKTIEEKELSKLKDSVFEMCGTYRYVAHKDTDKEINALLSQEIGVIALICIMCAFCFSRMVLALIENRANEYQTMFFCGATRNRIYGMILVHVLLVLNISAVFGFVVFKLIRMICPDLITYKRDNLFLYVVSYLMFIISGIITTYTLMIVRRRKYGNRS